jgi:hypothetical protein
MKSLSSFAGQCFAVNEHGAVTLGSYRSERKCSGGHNQGRGQFAPCTIVTQDSHAADESSCSGVPHMHACADVTVVFSTNFASLRVATSTSSTSHGMSP